MIVRTILSIPVAQDDAAEIFRSFSRYQQRTVPALVLNLFGLPQGLFVPYLRHHARPIRKWLARHIQSRLRGQKPAQADLLQALIDTNAFSPQQLVDQVSVLFLAGHETSASALAMAGYLLSQDPARQQRVRQEVLEQTQSPATPEELRRLSFTQAVWKETLRLYPPLPFLPRQNQKEEVLAGAHCPMRSIVTVSPWVLQRHRSLWPQAESFNPERFLEPESAVLEQQAFLPFGLGPRRCPGSGFAQQEGLLLLSELVRHFEILPSARPAPELQGRLTLRSTHGVHVCLKRRDQVREL